LELFDQEAQDIVKQAWTDVGVFGGGNRGGEL